MSRSNFTRRDVIGGAVTFSLVTAAVSDEIAHTAPRIADDAALTDYFLDFSEAATGFSRADLESTGQGEAYFATARDILEGNRFEDFLRAYHDSGLQALLSSPKFGPIARNMIKLWYTATWERLPRKWQDDYGSISNDTKFVVSAEAYKTGLLWPAIGVNPPGAHGPGYGAWSDAPSRT